MDPTMVEIRAIVRLELLERVVHALKDAGVPRLTATRVRAIGSGVDPAAAAVSLDTGSESMDKALVQFVCRGERCEDFTRLIADAARTGRRGDGIVTVHPVLSVTKVRTGATGADALA